MSRQRSNQKEWKKACNRKQRRSNKQNIDIDDVDNNKCVNHYRDTHYGDIWVSPNDGCNWRRGRGHDKKKPWRD